MTRYPSWIHGATGALQLFVCLAGVLLFFSPAHATLMLVDDFSGRQLGTRTITGLPLPGTSTTPTATATEANGELLLTMGRGGNGQSGIQLDYDSAATPADLTANGTNNYLVLESNGMEGLTASIDKLKATVSVTDTDDVTGSYTVNFFQPSAQTRSVAFTSIVNAQAISPNFHAVKHVRVLLLCAPSFTYTMTVRLNAIRCTPSGGKSAAPSPSVSCGYDNYTPTLTIDFYVNFNVDGRYDNRGLTASNVAVGGTASGTLVATVTGGGLSSYKVSISGMTSSGNVTLQILAGVIEDSWGQTNPDSSIYTESFNLAVPPVFTSPSTVVIQEYTQVGFTPTASGNPAPTITRLAGGQVPPNTIFIFGRLSGNPPFGTAGNYGITLKATNGFAPDVIQNLLIRVIGWPAVGSPVITAVTTTTATLGATITNTGNDPITAAGVAYGTGGWPENTGTKGTSSATSGAFTVNVTELQPNTVYYIRGYATNSVGTTYSGNPSFTTLPTAPTPQASPAADITPSSFTAVWTAPSGSATITGYRLDVSTSNTFASFVTGYNNLSITGTEQTVSGLIPSMTYYYRVRAVNAGGTSVSSTTGSTDTAALTAPTSITASDGAAIGTVTLSWPAVTGATHYQVSRAASAEGDRTALGTWQADTSYTDTPPMVGVDYHYWVKAAVGAGTYVGASSPSDTGWASLSAPENFTASDNDSTTSVTLSWDPLATLPAGSRYRVYRAYTHSPTTWTAVTGWVAGSTAQDTTGMPGSTYLYTVAAAVNATGTREGVKSTVDEGVRVATYQPDLLIKGPDDADYLGQNVYNDASEQTATASTQTTAIYYLQLASDGNRAENPALFGPAEVDGWTLRYFHEGIYGLVDITDAVTSPAGWASLIGPLNVVIVRVEVTAGATVAAGATCTAEFTLQSENDAAKADVVVATTTAPLLQLLTLDVSPVSPTLLGTALTLTAIPTGGMKLEYRFRAKYTDGTGGVVWLTLREYDPQATWTGALPDDAPRAYTLYAYAREQGSTANYQKFATRLMTTKAPLTGLSLQVAPNPVMVVGTRLTATALPTGGAKLEYRFEVVYPTDNGEARTVLQEFSPGATWTGTLPIDTPRAYDLYIYAREQEDAEDQAEAFLSLETTTPLTMLALEITSATSVTTGTTVTLTAIPTGGANLEYSFKVKYYDATGTLVWMPIRDYAATASCTWIPSLPTRYIVYAYAREQGSTSAKYGTMLLAATTSLEGVTLTVTPEVTPMTAGTPLILSATPTGGVELEYLFKARYYDAEGTAVWVPIRDYAAASTYRWTPLLAKNYTVYVYAREVGSTNVKYATKMFSTTLSGVTLEVTPAVTPVTVGTALTLTAEATGGAVLEYLFKAKYVDGTGATVWVPIQDYDPAAEVVWTPQQATRYYIYVFVREQGSTAVYQKLAYTSYIVRAP